jgi:hypothetical protein
MEKKEDNFKLKYQVAFINRFTDGNSYMDKRKYIGNIIISYVGKDTNIIKESNNSLYIMANALPQDCIKEILDYIEKELKRDEIDYSDI